MALKLSDKDIEALSSLKEYAAKDVYDKEDMYALLKGEGTIPGDQPEFVRYIFDEICRVVFTHEWQPIGTCRHASITIKKNSEVIGEQNIAKILLCLGFDEGHVNTYIEEGTVFNAIQLI